MTETFSIRQVADAKKWEWRPILPGHLELFDRLEDKWRGSVGRHSHFYPAQPGPQSGLEDFICFWKVNKDGEVLLLYNMV